MSDTALVLGAGIVGICCALALQERGMAVVLVDRDAPGHGASFGNAGVIQAEAVAPYAMPRAPWALARMALGRRAALHYTWRGMVEQAPDLRRYWRASAPAAHARATAAYAPLIRAARPAHEALIAASGAQDCITGSGLSEVFRDGAALQARIAEAKTVRAAWGVGFEVWEGTPPAALSGITGPHAGGLTWSDALALNDPHALASRYLARFKAGQGRVLRGDAGGLTQKGAGWELPTAEGAVSAAHVVIAIGASVNALAPLTGIRVPLVAKRGYHAHFAPDPAHGLAHPVVDEAEGYVVAPMRAGLRLTTGAQLLGAAQKPDPTPVMRAERAARGLFALGAREAAPAWSGVRPCTADMLPVIGPVRARPGLWYATGHGHQGLTLAAITGALLGDAMTGTTPALSLAPFAPERFAA